MNDAQRDTAIIAQGEAIMEIQEQMETVANALKNLSPNNPGTGDSVQTGWNAFYKAFQDTTDEEKPDGLPFQYPKSSEIMESIWAMAVGGSIPFPEGEIKMIRKSNIAAGDSGEIQIHCSNFVGGFQRLGIRADFREVGQKLIEVNVWMAHVTHNPAWAEDYGNNWYADPAHQSAWGYYKCTGMRPADGYTCKEVNHLVDRVEGAPSIAELRAAWPWD